MLEQRKKIAFIINPVSGNNSKKNIPKMIDKSLDKNKFLAQILFTEERGHATKIAKELLENGVHRIVAVGGDGTINEVAKSLIHTEGILGIVPSGSGNGLARHLGIPLGPTKAIELFNNDNFIQMDTCTLNGMPFFCTSGVGFDAHIGKLFAQQSKRGFKTYIKTTLSEFLNYKSYAYTLFFNDEEITQEAFLITIGNTSQYGNNALICPYADVQDGLMDISLIAPFPKFFALDLARRLFGGSIDKSRYLKVFQTKELKIIRQNPGSVHLDGEPFEMGESLYLKIFPSSLKILVNP
jgi:YegS/Rv2252/BmrU family lipid kinase